MLEECHNELSFHDKSSRLFCIEAYYLLENDQLISLFYHGVFCIIFQLNIIPFDIIIQCKTRIEGSIIDIMLYSSWHHSMINEPGLFFLILVYSIYP